jgi:sugar lactone lactonase YvrE
VAAALLLPLLVLPPQSVSAGDDGTAHGRETKVAPDPVFADGGVLAGSTNGISFAPDGTLYVANVFGSTITQIDPDSGEVLSRLTAADGVFFPDDVLVAPDGTIYWTEIALGNVFKKPVGEPAFPLLPGLFVTPGLNSANPLALSDDGRLFAAGCYGGDDNSFVEIDNDGSDGYDGITNVLFGPVADCASNGMSWQDGFLYSPQPFLNEVVRVDPDTGERAAVTTDWPVPIGTAFGSDGALYALAQGVGEVVRIDLGNTDTANNRTVIAEIPVAWADNIAVLPVDGGADRIFISSATDSTIVEVLGDGELRTVVPGQFQLPLGVNVIGNTLYTTNSSQIVGFDRTTGRQTSVFRAPFGFGYPFAISSVAWGDNLVLMSAFSGEITLWDPVDNVALAQGPVPVFPIDGQPFKGDLIVTTAAPDGAIYRLGPDLAPIDLVGNVSGATGIAAKGGDVYVADGDDGTIVQIIDNRRTLATPVVVFDGLDSPEGIDIKGNVMYVVEGGSETLTSIDMRNGKRTTVATDLGLQGPFLFPFGYLNNVTVAGNDIYVNADRRNVIYEF